jgi:hypothetical protein
VSHRSGKASSRWEMAGDLIRFVRIGRRMLCQYRAAAKDSSPPKRACDH